MAKQNNNINMVVPTASAFPATPPAIVQTRNSSDRTTRQPRELPMLSVYKNPTVAPKGGYFLNVGFPAQCEEENLPIIKFDEDTLQESINLFPDATIWNINVLEPAERGGNPCVVVLTTVTSCFPDKVTIDRIEEDGYLMPGNRIVFIPQSGPDYLGMMVYDVR